MQRNRPQIILCYNIASHISLWRLRDKFLFFSIVVFLNSNQFIATICYRFPPMLVLHYIPPIIRVNLGGTLWRLRDKFLFFSIYFASEFLSQAILQNALQLSVVSSQIIANNLNFCVPIIFLVPNITILCLLILPTCVYWKRYLPSLARNLTVIELFVMFHMRAKLC